ncbi:MAG: DUF6454 family protein [Pirellulales bacterium]
MPKPGLSLQRVLPGARQGIAAAVLCWRVVLVDLDLAIADDHVLVLASSWHIEHPTHHVQGLAVDDRSLWITSVQRESEQGWVYRVDRTTLKVVAERRLVAGMQIHPGGIQLTGQSLWVPLAEYRPNSSSTVLRLDADTLQTDASFTVDDHLGAIASDGNERLYAANWDSRQIYTFNHDGRQLGVRDNETGIKFQDLEWHAGLLYGVGRVKHDGQDVGVVVAFEPTTGKVTDQWRLTGTTRKGESDFGREGFSMWRRDFFVMPEDGPNTTIYQFLAPQP